MAKLGDFGTRREVQEPVEGMEEVTFGWFGMEVRLAQHYNQVKLMNLMEAARTVDREDPMAMVVIKDTLRVLVHPADFNMFWHLAEAEDQEMEDLAKLIQAIFEAMVRRPTQPLPDSSPGQRATPASSPADSPTPVSLGRPDLQAIVDGGKESRAKIAAAAAEAASAGLR
jgi:hypothetical protein